MGGERRSLIDRGTVCDLERERERGRVEKRERKRGSERGSET